ncbi:DNA topoisomerase IB [Actinokineospora sp. HUAS TT18]|uniref:DNA topoisomerase IB n=1 Tax=Actinokineospora sp. HUAS TT18 TaxID=3447451 RepID=UPI003F51D264
MRLRRVDPDGSGLRRVRHGRGFRYLDADGDPVTDRETLDRVRALVIPPAWRDVWICPHPGGHIQVVGVDDAGRRQYLYHEKWRQKRDEEKHDRVVQLARDLPKIRAKVAKDLAASGLGRSRVLAGALRILDLGIFRTGGESYAEENGSHGVATLLRGHVSLVRGELVFCFPAKSGVERTASVRDPQLARLVRSLRRGRSDEQRLFAYRDGREVKDIHADDINERFHELAGDGYTVKDMRTWTATVLAAAEFAGRDTPGSPTAAKRTEAEVMRVVAEQLGNTPAVARRSYVDPRVPDLYREGRTITVRNDDSTSRGRLERAVLRLLG